MDYSRKTKQKIDEMTGIIRESRKTYRDAAEPLARNVEIDKRHIKIKPLPVGVGKIKGPKRAREALESLIKHLMNPDTHWRFEASDEAVEHRLDRMIELIDFDVLADKTGLRLTVKQAHTSVVADRTSSHNLAQPYTGYSILAEIVDEKKPLGQLVYQHQLNCDEQKSKLRKLQAEAEAAMERARLAVLAEVPAMISGGAWTVTMPVVNWHKPRQTEASTELVVRCPSFC